MQIETIGKYQLHLIAHEMSDGRWDPFVAIFRFDDAAQDFRCVQAKQRAATEPCSSYAEAMDAARRTGTALMRSETL
jgi:hypothetical protein